MGKYRFLNENNEHLHQISEDGKEWKNLTGCTTILSVVAKPALIQWAANMTADFIKTFLLGSENKTFNSEELLPILEDARKAHTKRKEKAGDWGKIVHKMIEDWIITSEIPSEVELDNEKCKVEDSHKKALNHFIDWATKNKVKFLEAEKNIYSEKLWIGGIVDFVCEIDDKKWIGDIKTARSGIYPENMWQCAGYDLMLEEMGEPEVSGYLILNIKESGEFVEKRSISNKENKTAFLSCLNIYRTLEKIKKTI